MHKKPRYVPNGTYRVFFCLQTVCPTAIFNFPFSTFNFKKLSLWHNKFFTLQTIYTNWERRLAVRASNERPYWIAKTITILRSGIICFFDITNYLHEHKKSARRADCNFCLTNHPNKCTILEEPRTTRLDIKYAT